MVFFLTEPATANRQFRSIYSTFGKAFAESNKSKDDFAPNKGYDKNTKKFSVRTIRLDFRV